MSSTTATPAVRANSIPSTGDRFLDEAVDRLSVVAKVAIVTLLKLHGQDDRVDGVRGRIGATIAHLMDPDVLREYCESLDDGETEESVWYWAALASGLDFAN